MYVVVVVVGVHFDIERIPFLKYIIYIYIYIYIYNRLNGQVAQIISAGVVVGAVVSVVVGNDDDNDEEMMIK